ncbi:GerMN domain-containing protein [Peribacillus sp. SCS-155]|uniref:GerMN domain-containing protein n=1 Tax=Peribacillus sedimenti TaxID=3115297 RepID=UPI003906D2CD
MSKVTKAAAASTILISSVLLSGCGLFGGEEKNKIDPPKTTSYDMKNEAQIEKNDNAGAKEEGEVKGVKTELYLIDKNGYVVPQTLVLPKAEAVAKQALEYLVQNGPVTEVLPNGFRAVIPADTQVDLSVKEGVATVDFSPEFKEYKKEDEMKILQSITWTLTQFDSIQKVKLKMNGKELKEMPVNGTPIQETLTRADGINLDTSNVSDITNTKPLTVYYIGGDEGTYYYVPVTRRVSENQDDNVTAAVQELIKGPSHSSKLLSDFMPDLQLLSTPVVAKGKVTLNFNESILGSFKEKKVSQNVLDALVLSLTEQKGIDSVEVQVNGSTKLLNEDGKPLSEPVTRPEKVNTGSF